MYKNILYINYHISAEQKNSFFTFKYMFKYIYAKYMEDRGGT